MNAPCLCIERMNDVAVATVTTESMDETLATELVDELIGCIRYDNVHHFVIDLAQVRRINSAALQALINLLQELEHIHGRVVIANCTPTVESVFTTTRLDSLFDIFDDVEDALAEVTPQ
jgi:anti-sigma B factor antagonist